MVRVGIRDNERQILSERGKDMNNVIGNAANIASNSMELKKLHF